MNPGLVTAGAFLFVLGIATILAIPVVFMQYGPNYLAPGVAFLVVIVASVGGAILAYGVSTNFQSVCSSFWYHSRRKRYHL